MNETIVSVWQKSQFWRVGRYVIMPDHVHFFVSPGVFPPTSLRFWMSYWKRSVTLLVARSSKPLWQKNFWDTQLRNGESYSAKWEYVRNNPVRAGLAASADDWPHQGELNQLTWHDR